MSTLISKYVLDATHLKLSHPTLGFNTAFAAVTSIYNIQPLVIDWSRDSSQQYFEANLTPDDLEESSSVKYPMAFLYGLSSQNTHQSLGRKFSGQVKATFSIWQTHKAADALKAGRYLERASHAVEAVMNDLFYDGNWPQGYGASNAICMPPSCTRTPVQAVGEAWRQALGFNLVFTVDTN